MPGQRWIGSGGGPGEVVREAVYTVTLSNVVSLLNVRWTIKSQTECRKKHKIEIREPHNLSDRMLDIMPGKKCMPE